MTRSMLSHVLLASSVSILSSLAAAAPLPGNDPLAAIDLNRNAIIADIVQGFEGDREALAKRLAGLRADRLLSASLASSRASIDSILAEAEKSRDAAVSRASAKALGSPTTDLVYTPLTPCRLIDTRGFGAPIQGGVFAANARRSYVPQGLCGLPTEKVVTILISFTTQNLTPNSGGFLAILAPNAPVSASVDVFNLGSEWSASNTAVNTGSAAQFDVLVAVASAHVVIDVLGYFAPPQGGAVTSITAGTGLTGGTITSTGTIGIATTHQLPQACTNGQVAQSNGTGGWICATPVVTGGTVTGVTATAPLASTGGNAPNVSLTGIVSVANGGTGRATLPANGVLFGLGTGAVGTAVGTPGSVLVGTGGAPAWTTTPFIDGNIVLVQSTPTAGNIMKGSDRFLHNFGVSNTFAGSDAGNFTMLGGSNTGLGRTALFANVMGFDNTAVGALSLQNNVSGESNTAVGARTLSANVGGIGNTAVGVDGLASNFVGNFNTALGTFSLVSNTSGFQNVAVGGGTLGTNVSGGNNIAVGFASGSQTTGSSNITIGNQGLAAENNTIRIGTGQTRAFFAGIRGVTTAAAAIPVLVDTNGQLGTTSSSRRFKDDIADMDAASEALMKLRPVTFHYKADKSSSQAALQYGLIAEEVAEVYPGLVAHSADGQVETVMYQYLPAMMLNEVQKQQRTIRAQADELNRQAMRIAELERERQAQATDIAALKQQSKRLAVALDRLAPVNVARQ